MRKSNQTEQNRGKSKQKYTFYRPCLGVKLIFDWMPINLRTLDTFLCNCRLWCYLYLWLESTNYQKEQFQLRKAGVEEIPGFDNICYSLVTTATNALTLLQARYLFGSRKGNPISIENPLLQQYRLVLRQITSNTFDQTILQFLYFTDSIRSR